MTILVLVTCCLCGLFGCNSFSIFFSFFSYVACYLCQACAVVLCLQEMHNLDSGPTRVAQQGTREGDSFDSTRLVGRTRKKIMESQLDVPRNYVFELKSYMQWNGLINNRISYFLLEELAILCSENICFASQAFR